MLAGDAERDPVLRNSKPKLGRYLGKPIQRLAPGRCRDRVYIYHVPVFDRRSFIYRTKHLKAVTCRRAHASFMSNIPS